MLAPCPAQAARQKLSPTLDLDMIRRSMFISCLCLSAVTDQLGFGMKASHKTQ